MIIFLKCDEYGYENMPYENFKRITLQDIITYYNPTFKSLIRAKDLLGMDYRISGSELEQKKTLVSLLEDTYTPMCSAKTYYDKGTIGCTKSELDLVFWRLRRIKEMCGKFPYRKDCEVEKIIRKERRRISDLYTFVTGDYPWLEK